MKQGLDSFHKNAKQKDGLAIWCKECAGFNARRWYAKNPSKHRDAARRHYHDSKTRLRAYGLTQEDYDDIITRQSGVCAICAQEMPRPNIDHDHRTGKVRGVLCPRCNVLIGYIETNSARLGRVRDYLTLHESHVLFPVFDD